jgi:hypothetical protein
LSVPWTGSSVIRVQCGACPASGSRISIVQTIRRHNRAITGGTSRMMFPIRHSPNRRRRQSTIRRRLSSRAIRISRVPCRTGQQRRIRRSRRGRHRPPLCSLHRNRFGRPPGPLRGRRSGRFRRGADLPPPTLILWPFVVCRQRAVDLRVQLGARMAKAEAYNHKSVTMTPPIAP